MWEASRWLTDPTYHAPMVSCNGKHVFAGDVCKVKCQNDEENGDGDGDGVKYFECAKVMSFFVDEKVLHTMIMLTSYKQKLEIHTCTIQPYRTT